MTTIVTRKVGGTGATNAASALAALNGVSKSGDEITGNVIISVDVPQDALRITQVGSGNALVVEDSTNPDLTPFLISNTGNVGIGISTPLSYFHANVGSLRMIVQTDSTGGTSPLNLWNSNTGNTAGAGMVFCIGGDGVTTGFAGGISTRKIDANNSRTSLRVLTGTALTAVGAGYMPFYLEGENNVSLARIVLDGNVFIGSTTGGTISPVPNANLHVTGTIIDTPVVTITSNATFNENAAGRVILASNTSAITVTIANTTTTSAGFTYTVIRGNSGNVTLAVSGVTRFNSASYTSMNIVQNGAATIVYTATNQVFVFGDFV